jgi:hypothetical protein
MIVISYRKFGATRCNKSKGSPVVCFPCRKALWRVTFQASSVNKLISQAHVESHDEIRGGHI